MSLSKRNRLATFYAFVALVLCIAGVLRASNGPAISLGGTLGASGPGPILAWNTLALSGSSPVTLDQAHLSSTSLRFTGTTTGTIAVTAPLAPGMVYNLQNATNNPITFGGATGTLVTIPAGAPALAVCQDGANYFNLAATAGTAIYPLSHTLVVDGSFAGGGTPNGTFASPYTTISAALATIGQPVSVTDSFTLWDITLYSALGGYNSEPSNAVTIPAYRSTWLHAWSPNGGFQVGVGGTGTIGWTNTAAAGGSHPAAGASVLMLASLGPWNGNVVVVDDHTEVEGVYLTQGANLNGEIVGTGATDLFDVFLSDPGTAIEGTGINTPSATVFVENFAAVVGSGGSPILDAASLWVRGGGLVENLTTTVTGSIVLVGGGQLTSVTGTSGSLSCTGGAISGGSLSVSTATLSGCAMSGGFQLTATTVNTDAQSWGSYLAQGGLLNGATLTLQSAAYVPSTPANWSDAGVPTTVAQGLDRIAAALHGLTPPVYP